VEEIAGYYWPSSKPCSRSAIVRHQRHESRCRNDARRVRVIAAIGAGGPPSSGHLIYMLRGTLFAAPFDLDRLEMTGEPVPVLEGVVASTGTGRVQLAVSANGAREVILGG
jgi:hypothetical protein